MTDKTESSKVPVWVWVLGCLGLVALCAVLVVGGSLAYILVSARDNVATSGNEGAVEADAGPQEPPTELPASPLEDTVLPSPTAGSPLATNPPAATDTLPATDPSSAADTPPASDFSSVEDVHASLRAEIEKNVVALRGLEPKEAVVPTMLSMSELRERLEDDLLEDYGPEVARDSAVAFSAFDFFPADFDLYNVTLDLLTEQIAGFYEPDTGEFVLVSDDADFDGLDQLTHAHEYAHALQDQYFELELLGEDSLDSEASFALSALAEGDATLVQTQYLLGGYLDVQEMLDLLGELGQLDLDVLNSAPTILAHELEFPYTAGLGFVQTLYDQGGYAAVNDAWETLPQSTEQILHPERYLAGDVPQLTTLNPLTDTLGSGWRQVDEDVFGEFYLREYLAQQLEAGEVNVAATGWGGDRYAVHWNEEDQAIVMVLRLAWDTTADEEEFAAAYVNYPTRLFNRSAEEQPDGGLCWQADDVICFYRTAGESLIVRAPDLELAGRIAAAQLS